MVAAVAKVTLWGKTVGALALQPDASSAFEYDPQWLARGIEISPLKLPAKPGIFQFPGLNPDTFRGLPGAFADTLPDDFGNTVINAWLERQGIPKEDFGTLDRLLYTGARGMGALEYEPAKKFPKGFGRMEYAYYRMAIDAGIIMEPSELLEEGGRAHFLTRRFDRDGNHKRHYQSLCAIDHADYKKPGHYSYEELFTTARRLCLTPAFDIAYSYKPDSPWVNSHQMSLNGKRDHFTLDDLLALASQIGEFKTEARRVIEQISDIVAIWPQYAEKASVPESLAGEIYENLRLFNQ